MRARQPDRADVVERTGVKVAYEVVGAGEPGLLLIPAAPISHARSWKGLVPFLSRHFTVVTVDPRGNGPSDRPAGRAAYGPAEMLADQLAVLDAVGLTRAVVVAHCHAVPWALRLAADHADRVSGVVAIAPGIVLAPRHEHWAEPLERWADEVDNPTGWGLYNRHFWRQDYPAWPRFFFDQLLPEPHSTKQYEDAVSWALETDPETMIAESEGRDQPKDRQAAEALCRSVRCPTLVIHGTEDRCQPVARGQRLAELTGGDLVVLEGAGHLPQGREPVKVNRLVKEFVDRIEGEPMRRQVWTRGLHSPRGRCTSRRRSGSVMPAATSPWSRS
jgi:pimeloyl-ACP methyl ester carboxylesterase